MNLSDFIALRLDEVMDGVTKAALKQKESGRFGFINPMDGETGDEFSFIPIASVSFDIAITAKAPTIAKRAVE